MATLSITSENQVQRLNILLNAIESLKNLEADYLTKRPNDTAWSIIEIIEHLNISYGFYRYKVDEVLSKSATIEGESIPFKCRVWQRFVINGQRPKDGKRKWKMKTLRRFQPVFSMEDLSEDFVKEVFSNFENSYGHLKESILTGRRKDLSKFKISSAIGPIVNFYLPEAFEFLLCHAERHLVQIEVARAFLDTDKKAKDFKD